MKLWKDLKIRTKQMVLIGISCTSLLVVGGVGMLEMRSLSRHLSEANDSLHHVALLGEMKNNFLSIRYDLVAMLSVKDLVKLKARQEDFNKRVVEVRECAKKFEASQIDATEREQIGGFKASFEEYVIQGSKLAQMASAAHEQKDAAAEAAAIAFNFEKVAPLSVRPSEIILALVDSNLKDSETSYLADLQTYRRQSIMMSCIISGAVAFALCFGIAIYRSIAGPLGKILRTMSRVAEGDLTARSEINSGDEMGQLAREVNAMADKVHDMTTDVAMSSIKVSIAANHLHAMSDMLLKGFENLVGQSTTIATAGEEVAATSSDIALNCNDAARNGALANDAALSGGSVVDNTVAGMNRIAERVKHSARSVDDLGRRSDQIGEIIGTIEDIADQTNLLALNAAIEAARAGEQGRGFAVVADEVRALAERTTKATKEIGAMIKAIQTETKQAVTSMEEGVSEVTRESAGAAQSGVALQLILGQVDAVTQQVNQIATATEQQTATTSEISRNISQITDIAQQSSQESRKITAEVNQLMTLSAELTNIIGRFQINEDKHLVMNKAKSAHLVFTGKIRAHLDGHAKLDPNTLLDHHNCMFGKWYDSDGTAACGQKTSFQDIATPHARVHELGKAAILAHDAGNQVKAAELCAEMVQNSTTLLGLLEELERQCV
jgi:methyl-accepting chemotaxis protein